MKRFLIMVAAGALLAGCGEKVQEAKNAMNAVETMNEAAKNVEQGQNEAEKFYEERRSKGDTVAMPYAELQKFLPSSIDGYTPAEEPSGSSQSMGAFSMSQAEQTFTGTANADGNTPTIKVTLIDFGGTQAGYGMMALPMMMNISQEDGHRRAGTVKFDVPYTNGYEEYNKDSKDTKLTAVTRYRYSIVVEASNQSEDHSDMVKSLAADIAKKFDEK